MRWSPAARTSVFSPCPAVARGMGIPSRQLSVICASRSKRNSHEEESHQSGSLVAQKPSFQLAPLAVTRLSLRDYAAIGSRTRPSMQLSKYSLLCYAENQWLLYAPLGLCCSRGTRPEAVGNRGHHTFVAFVSLTKYPRCVTISANNLIIWTLLSRGVEGPALRNPGNRFGD